MARKRYGQLNSITAFKRQPDAELAYLDTGLVEGELIYAIDDGAWGNIVQFVGAAHPDDPNVTLYRVRRRKMKLGITLAIFDCIGISRDPTARVVQYNSSISTERIETHPNFSDTEFAGTPDAPQNGAVWEKDSEGNVIGFAGFMGEDAPDELRGVTSYYTGSVVCRATYYTRRPPRFSPIMKKTSNLPNIPDLVGVPDWLYLSPSAEQVGSARLWRVTEEYLGSGPNGWSDIIYGGD